MAQFPDEWSAIPAKGKKPSHSCEGRNLRRCEAAGNCTITAFGV
ncbi:MAG: hypothetical protein ACR2QC_06520 [Gammaproteobacteria bacterium]